MNTKGLVSVVIPTYNRAHTLSRAIESVLSQTYPYWELIIVDNFSQDKSDILVKSFQTIAYNSSRTRILVLLLLHATLVSLNQKVNSLHAWTVMIGGQIQSLKEVFHTCHAVMILSTQILSSLIHLLISLVYLVKDKCSLVYLAIFFTVEIPLPVQA